MENGSRNTNKASRRLTIKGGSQTRLVVTSILIIILLAACQGTTTPVVETPSTPPVTEAPTEQPTEQPTEAPTEQPTEQPTEAPNEEPVVIPCDGADGTYTCPGLDGHTVTLSDVPDDVVPALLEVTEERKQELLEAPREDTSCIFMIAADVVFFDTENNLIEQPDFSEPVTIMFDFNATDMEGFNKCQAAMTVPAGTTITNVPVYYHKKIWKPFEEGTYEVSDNTVTIKFTTWGDQPIGGGTQP